MQHLTTELARRLLADDLDPHDRARWRNHLRQCADCRRLLDDERAFGEVLELGDPPAPLTGLDLSSTLEQIEPIVPGGAQRRLRRRRRTIVAAVGVVILSGLLVVQIVSTLHPADDLPTDLHISPTIQQRVVARLDALLAVQREPWLADDLEAVRMLESLVASRGTTP